MRSTVSKLANVSLLAGAGMMAISTAFAADRAVLHAPEYKVRHAPEHVNWSGFYAGGNIGFGGFGTNVTDLSGDMFDGAGSELNVFGNSAIAGGQVGYNIMEGRYLFGIESDLQWTSFSKRTSMDGDDHRAAGAWNWYGTTRARLGIAHQNSLFYVTGGIAYVNAYYCGADGACVTDGDEDLAFTSTRFGYTAGAGVEVRISDRWSVKGEYLYVAVPSFDRRYDTDESASFRTQAHTFRLGLNYHFGGLGPHFASVPKYAPFDGAYVGVSGGLGGFGTGVTDLSGDMFDGAGSEMNMFGNGALFGAQAGFNRAYGNYVLGLEADIHGTTYSVRSVTDGDDHQAGGAWKWFATVRGRAGVTVGDTLFYGTGGLALINAYYCGADSGCITDGDENLAFTSTRLGYVVGAGAETKLSDRLSLKGEYLFVDAGSFTRVYDAGANERAKFRTSGHVFKVGLNYQFGDVGKGPVSAKY